MTPRKDRRPSDIDALVRAYAGAKPLRGRNTRAAVPTPPREETARLALDPPAPPVATPKRITQARMIVERVEETVRAFREDRGRSALRELRARRIGEHSKLDLHGLRAEEARFQLEDFIIRRLRARDRLLLLVHGKGTHSAHGIGVLREVAVEALLALATQHRIVAFQTAPAHLGGSGALLVLLAS